MNTYQIAHRFFHEPDKRGEYANVNTSFQYYTTRDGQLVWRYFSFSTCIGEIRRNRRGEQVLVISNNKYSKVTSKHIYQLLQSCPFDGDHILCVPRVGNGFYYNSIIGTYDFLAVLRGIASLTEKDLRRQENRHYVQGMVRMYDRYAEQMRDLTPEEKRLRKSARVLHSIDIAKEKDAALQARREHVATPEELAKRAEQRAKREERIRRKMDEFLGEGDSLDKLRTAFSGRGYWRRGHQYDFKGVTDPTIKKALTEYRDILEKKRDDHGRTFSYAWIVGDMVKTSRYCEAPVEDAKRLCRLWKRHQDMVGCKAGVYTVLENTPDYIKIGCHIIPKWNIDLLCEAFKITA